MTAGIILAIMVTPIVTSITREVFATTPLALKEGALALGATRWEMIRGSILPHGRSGLVSAVLIGLGRAMGETIAVALVIGSSAQITAKLLGSGDTMAAVIVNQFGEASPLTRSALIGLGVVLFGITIVVGVIAAESRRATRNERKGPDEPVHLAAPPAPPAARQSLGSGPRGAGAVSAGEERDCLLAPRALVRGRDDPALLRPRVRRQPRRGNGQRSLPHRRHPLQRPSGRRREWARPSSGRCSSPAPRR